MRLRNIRLSHVILAICYTYFIFELGFCSLMLAHDAFKHYQAPDTVFAPPTTMDDVTAQAYADLDASAKRRKAQDEERELMRPLKQGCPPLTNLSPRQQIQRVNEILGAAPADLEKLEKR